MRYIKKKKNAKIGASQDSFGFFFSHPCLGIVSWTIVFHHRDGVFLKINFLRSSLLEESKIMRCPQLSGLFLVDVEI